MNAGLSRAWMLVGAVCGGLLVAACGGGGKSADGTKTASGGDASDKAFVVGLCQAATDAAKVIGGSSADPSATPDDIGAAFEQFFAGLAPAMEKFSADFAKLTPPADLKDWHANTAKSLTAAAKALKEGNFDDPALESVSGNPTSDMPAAARDRLKAIADKEAGCKDLDLFTDDSSNGGTNGGRFDSTPTPALQDAAKGTWSGKYGTVTFKADGTAVFALTACGVSSFSKEPFGVDADCDGQTYTGKLDVSHNEYLLRDSQGVGQGFAAYADKSGKLHVGIGTVSAFGPGRKGTITIFAESDLVVDGDSCSHAPFGNGDKPEKVECHWTTEQGADVLVYTGSFGDDEKLVSLPDEGLIVSPEIYVSAFAKQ